jgi:gliding motility-associated-like protein
VSKSYIFVIIKPFVFISFLWLFCWAQAQHYFTPNAGQWQNGALARNMQKTGALFIESNGFKIRQVEEKASFEKHQLFHGHYKKSELKILGNNLFFTWENGMAQKTDFYDSANYYENYFIGEDSKSWQSHIYPVNSILQRNMYPGVDIRYYGIEEGVEFDIIVKPQGNLNNVKLSWQGATKAYLQNGQAVFEHGVGHFLLESPIAYQVINGQRLSVYCSYFMSYSGLQFICNEYNPNYELIIDPVLVFSTYSGSKGDNFGFTATFDSKGNLYAGGIVDTTQGTYPVSAGSFQTNYGGVGLGRAPVNLGCDISISKYSSDGKNLIYASYYGGRDDEFPHSLVCDGFDNLLVLGTTWSNNFPTTIGAYDRTFNGGTDIIVGKMSEDGTQLLASTYIGGSAIDGFNGVALSFNYADEFRGDIITDASGEVYIATTTRSTNFPVSSNAYKNTLGGANDAVYLHLPASLSTINYATYIGGSGDDAAYSVKLQDTLVYIGGGTASAGITWPSPSFQANYGGGSADGFICAFDKRDGTLKYGTYYGSNNYDQVYFIETDILGRIYGTGQTSGTIARTPGTYGKDNTKQFIVCMKPSADSIWFRTNFGNRTTEPELSPSAFMVDNCFNIYFSGWGSFNGTTANLEVTNDAYQKVTDGSDFYLVVMSRDAKSVVFATYFGGNQSDDHVDGGTSRFDKSGVVYQSVCASCPNQPPGLQDFPTTAGAAFTSNPSYRCSNASFKLNFNITYAVDANFIYSPSVICTNRPIYFSNLSKPGLSVFWNFGDGDTSREFSPTHLYKKEGTYKVLLTVVDSISCNVSATKELTVLVGASPNPEWNITSKDCSNEYQFELLKNPDLSSNFYWQVGADSVYGEYKFTRNLSMGSAKVNLMVKHKDYNCYDTLTTTLNVGKDSSGLILLSNAFTPNSDNKNDCWNARGLTQECDKMDLRIFNRWGERVFASTNPAECWRGYINKTSIQAPDGEYFYILTIIESVRYPKNYRVKGSITLMR